MLNSSMLLTAVWALLVPIGAFSVAQNYQYPAQAVQPASVVSAPTAQTNQLRRNNYMPQYPAPTYMPHAYMMPAVPQAAVVYPSQGFSPMSAAAVMQYPSNYLAAPYPSNAVPRRSQPNRRQFQLEPEPLSLPDDEEECGVLRPRVGNYVANGESTHHHLWPWHVQLTIHANNYSDSETYCGGTLVAKNFIITAAHCYDEVSASRRAKSTTISMKGLEVSSSKKSTKKKSKSKKKDSVVSFKATNVYMHEEYVAAMSDEDAEKLGTLPGPRHDLALIEFDPEDDEIRKRLMPVCLPSAKYQMNIGTRCKIMGHGFMNSNDEDNFIMPDVLQMADVHISSNAACRSDVDSESIKSKISADTVCIRGPIHPCVGDSGGPLVCQGKSEKEIHGEDSVEDNDEEKSDATDRRWYLMGVTSFAVSTDENDKCGQFKSAVFGKVSNYVEWIQRMASNYN